MKKTTKLVTRWRISAMACAAALLLAGCGGGANDGGLSNGPQMAAATTAVPENASQADAAPEPAAPEPVVAAVEPAPAAPAPAGATAQPAAQSDSFAMKGYGNSATRQPSGGAEGNGQGGAAQAASGQPAGSGDAAQVAQDGSATADASIPADPAAQASAVPVPDGSNRSYGPSGAGFPAADTEPEMCKYGGCSFR
jgi:hypothetical protein